MNDIHIQIRPSSALTPLEQEALDQLDRAAFAPEPGAAPEPYVWAKSEYYITGALGERIVSSIGILVRRAKVEKQPVLLGGVGGVATHPDFRKRGYATALLKETARFLRDDLQVDFGLLVCDAIRIPLYCRVGWQVVPGRLEFDQPGGKACWLRVTMVLPCRIMDWPPGEIDLCGLPF